MDINQEMYTSFKPLLFSLAYRMLGSVVDAEDMVQETFITASKIKEEQVQNIKAYLCKITTNRCLDYLKSAQKQREVYVGPWLPEPLIIEGDNDPYHILVENEDLSIAYVKMMQHLSSNERIVFILRESMGFEYWEISKMINKTEQSCRQLLSRAKKKLENTSDETGTNNQMEQSNIIHGFIAAFQSGDIQKMMQFLSENVALFSDGGGKVKAAIRPIYSFERVISFLQGISNKTPDGFSFVLKNVNGQLGIVNYVCSLPQSTISFYVHKGKIEEIYLVINPDKLKHIPKQIQAT